ncbi:oxidoreductase [Aerococcus urinaehominis]|uniref:Oxidoreductase n=1 Tax=Aerococcus urinaehominis TaxID=128944 RepID=A0A0X8FKM8_9LACT|nr:Gfo/Idh/MocA family oxidoreductase [Aerococcus urinaehominis]AMB99076.1 oxidoreductase [Aerococcus urinaehominis]SDM02747.1 Predicted dehydrogenase [Aerococcus urinaehominis]
MLKVGIVGLGTVAIVHAKGILESPYADLVAVCDNDPTRAKDYSDFPFYTDLTEMLAQEDLDVVHVCLPHYLHDEATMTIARAGVHVLLEKPVSINAERSRQLLLDHQALANGTKVAVCFQNRLNETVQEMKRLLQAEGGEILAVKGLVPWFRPESYYSQKPWRGKWDEAGSGTIINQAIHTLDLMHYVTGNDWSACKALVGNLLDYDIEVEDTATANFEFTDGSHGFFMGTNAYYGNDSIELQVMTSNGRYTIKEDKLFDKDINCLAENERVPGTKIYYGPSHRNYFDSFYRAINDNTDDYCGLESALITMEMIDAMKLSSAENRIVNKEEFIHE